MVCLLLFGHGLRTCCFEGLCSMLGFDWFDAVGKVLGHEGFDIWFYSRFMQVNSMLVVYGLMFDRFGI